MTHPTDKLALPEGGTLYLTPCPGTKTLDLESTIKQLAEQGIKGLVSLTPKSEMQMLEVDNMPSICEQHGIKWFYAPVDDHQAPATAFANEWPKNKAAVHQLLDQNHGVALHCRGGQGRTGMLAAQLLIERGRDFEAAKAEVKAIKPGALTIEKQTVYLKSLLEK